MRSAILIAACAFPLSIGCSYQPPIERGQLDHGYILLLTGVECYGSYHQEFVRGLREGGVGAAIEVSEWGYKPFGTFKNLYNYPANRDIAARIAPRVIDYAKEHPNRPITLIGYSGGGAMALWLAESLPDPFQVDRIILSAPAISPRYDIGPALRHARRGMTVFYSARDWFMAGIATETWGTMDRVKTAAAGQLGFQDERGELLKCEGLTQIPWRPEWRPLGHDGGHSGWRARAWARQVLAPLLK